MSSGLRVHPSTRGDTHIRVPPLTIFCYTFYSMNQLSDEQFDALITRAMNELPQEYIKGLENVVIVMADEPTDEQRRKMNLQGHLLLGLFEGIPLTKKGNGFSGMLPDKITLFKNQILLMVSDEKALFEQIKRTLWHEIAHYYGLDHGRIHELEGRTKGF